MTDFSELNATLKELNSILTDDKPSDDKPTVDKVADVVETVKDNTSNAINNVVNTVKDTSNNLSNQAVNAVNNVKEKIVQNLPTPQYSQFPVYRQQPYIPSTNWGKIDLSNDYKMYNDFDRFIQQNNNKDSNDFFYKLMIGLFVCSLCIFFGVKTSKEVIHNLAVEWA